MHSHAALEGCPLDHVAVAVESIDDVLPALEAVTGSRGSRREALASHGVEVCFIGTGPGKLELLQPLGPDSPISRFLRTRGGGLHHVAYRVTDLDGLLRRLADGGIELIDHAPRQGAHGHRVAFVHPRSMGGILVELVEPAPLSSAE